MKQEYIVCSAIHVGDDSKMESSPFNIKSGYVAYGLRHHNCLEVISKIYYFNLGQKGYPKIYYTYIKTQGFLTSKNRFVTRKEAAQIAFDNNQTNKLLEILYSEDIY